MKIPETPNVGAYYGNEENNQWQPNGVIIDSGVGGGVVGSGDAGVHRPPVYPVHIPRGHIPGVYCSYILNPQIPGYVMAGAYFPPAYPPAPPAPQDDFADYMWMENEEEFDKQVMQQLEEEALMEQCIEAMLEDEQRERHRPVANGHNHFPTTSNGGGSVSLEEAVSRSTLNPLAAEFVPNRARPSGSEEKLEVSESRTEVTENSKEVPQHTAPSDTTVSEVTDSKMEEVIPKPAEPPEVSAADVQPIDKDKKLKDTKAKEVKKIVKPEVKVKVKPVVAKSETRIAPKKETRPAKSEPRLDKEEIMAVDVVKQPSPPAVEESQPISKPINYAAAAKANKPKNNPTPPLQKVDKPAPKITEKVDKKDKLKDKVKTEKPIPRKNSAK